MNAQTGKYLILAAIIPAIVVSLAIRSVFALENIKSKYDAMSVVLSLVRSDSELNEYREVAKSIPVATETSVFWMAYSDRLRRSSNEEANYALLQGLQKLRGVELYKLTLEAMHISDQGLLTGLKEEEKSFIQDCVETVQERKVYSHKEIMVDEMLPLLAARCQA